MPPRATIRVRFERAQVNAALRLLVRRSQSEARKVVAASARRIQNQARVLAPVDVGTLRSKILPKMFQGGLVAEIGSRVGYSAFIEFGTGLLNRVPAEALKEGAKKGKGRRYFPPPAALMPWVRRHKMPPEAAFAVAAAIYRRGGTPPKPFLFPAWEMEKGRFIREVMNALRRTAERPQG